MKHYYIVEENGYRTPVVGRRVQVWSWFETFYHIDNGKYLIRCIKTSSIFGTGDTLKEAKIDALEHIKRIGEQRLRDETRKRIKEQWPEGGR